MSRKKKKFWNTMGLGMFLAAFFLIAISCFIFISQTNTPTEAYLSPKPNKLPTCVGGDMNIVAHEDDDILFMNPDIQYDITAGKCMTTVYVTTGAYATGPQFAIRRENGPKAAYAEMASMPNVWIEGQTLIKNHSILSFSLKNDPKIKLIYMRLPNSKSNGKGWPFYDGQTIRALYEHNLQEIKAVDGSSVYTRRDLINTFSSLLEEYLPSVVRTQDYLEPFSSGDHNDHVTVGRFVENANSTVFYSHSLLVYNDYDIAKMPVNLSSRDVRAKAQTWDAYAPYDPNVCQSTFACKTMDSEYYMWISREYKAATLGTI